YITVSFGLSALLVSRESSSDDEKDSSEDEIDEDDSNEQERRVKRDTGNSRKYDSTDTLPRQKRSFYNPNTRTPPFIILQNRRFERYHYGRDWEHKRDILFAGRRFKPMVV
ncbi:unnamed protein product, partial [Owenia fusiformis]